MDSTALFSKTPPLKLFFIASLPGAIGMLASALYQTLDGVFIGQFLGDVAFAALNLAMPFVIINFSLADLIGVGSSVPISIALGRGERKEANNIFTCACIMIVGAGIIIGFVMFTAAPAIIRAMGAEGDFAEFAVQYLRVYALCSPVTTIMFAVDNFLRICGYIRGSMMLNIFMSLLSGIMEYIFLGVLKWGIWGAAAATCLGMFISVLIAFIPFLRGKALLHFCRPSFNKKMIKQTVTCGSPNFLNNIAGRITSIILNAVLVRIGGENAVSVCGVLMFAEGFIQPLMYGMCDSLQPAVGYNWGAGKYSRVRAIEKCCFTASCIVSLAAAVVVAAIPEQITRLFMADASSEIIEMAVIALRIFSVTFIFRWFSFATQSYMLAIEKSLQASLISVSTALVFPVILIVVLQPFGLNGLWCNFAGTAVLAGIMAAFILKKTRAELNRPDAVRQNAQTGE